MKKRFFILSIMMFLIATCYMEVSAQTYYVDSTSTSAKKDGAYKTPFASIQTAVDIVKPGDEIVVMPGIYYECIDIKNGGTQEKPIVIRAQDPGENKTIITRANKDIREGKVTWICEDPSINLYYIPYERNVASILYNGAKMFAYKSLEELKTFRTWYQGVKESTSTMDGFPHGYFYDKDEKKLYVRIGDGDKYGDTDPNKNLMAVGGPYYGSVERNGVMEGGHRYSAISVDSYCMGVITENSANIVISGFTFEVPGWAGVFCRADDVIVDNCWFRGCFAGVLGGRYTLYDPWTSENVTVQNCDWNLWPSFDDGIEVQKTKNNTKYLWNWWCTKSLDWGLFDYEAGAVITQVGKNWTLKDTKVYQCLDGITGGPMGTYVYLPQYNTNLITNHPENLKIQGCKFFDCIDNAIELENHSQGVEVVDCEFGNCMDAISWQPGDGEPWPTNIFVHNNIFKFDEWYVSLCYKSGNTPVQWFKVGAAVSNWDRPSMKMKGDVIVNGTSLFPIMLKDKGLWLYNNSVYLPDGYPINIPGNLLGKEQEKNNMHIVNNILYFRVQPEGKPYRTFIAVGEFIGPSKPIYYDTRNNIFVQSNPDKAKQNENVWGGKGFVSFEDAGIEWNGSEMYIKENSPCIDAGEQIWFEKRDTTDAGAIPYGGKWKINAGNYPLGDADRNGAVDIADVMTISKSIGKTKIDDDFDSKSDMNFDGIIDEKDLQYALIGASK